MNQNILEKIFKYKNMFIVKRIFWIVFFVAITMGLTGCNKNVTKFKKGDIRDDFCGIHMGIGYCDCALDSEDCDKVHMTRTEAKEYVYGQYEKWSEGERKHFFDKCRRLPGVIKGKKCIACQEGEVARNNVCYLEADEAAEEEIDPSWECRYNKDCSSECEGKMRWKQECNLDTHTCQRSLNTNCAVNIETIGGITFPNTCTAGECGRDVTAVEEKRVELEEKLKLLKLKDVPAEGADLVQAKDDKRVLEIKKLEGQIEELKK